MDHKGRREEIGQLKDRVKKLTEDNELLRNQNVKNAEGALKKENVMKRIVETLRKEIEDLKSDKENMYRELKVENEELQNRIHILSTCDICGECFDDRSIMREHILLKHQAEYFKCCENFRDERSLKEHKVKSHI